MTTIRQIITDTFREPGIIAAGEIVEAAQFEEALRRLQNLYSSLFGTALGEPLSSVNYGRSGDLNSYGIGQDLSPIYSSNYIPANVRLIFNTNTPTTLYLNPSPEDGARFAVLDNAESFSTSPVTLRGNGRQIDGASSVTLNTGSTNSEWFYRADLGQWVRVTDLVAEDESPLPKEFDDLLITLLAYRINPRYGATTSDEMTTVLNKMKQIFKARYKQSKEISSELGLLKLSTSSRVYWSQSSTNAFDTGRP